MGVVVPEGLEVLQPLASLACLANLGNQENRVGRGMNEEQLRRIETRVDDIYRWSARFDVDVAQRLSRLEMADQFANVNDSKQVSDRSFFWMKVGMASSFIVGVASVFAKFMGL